MTSTLVKQIVQRGQKQQQVATKLQHHLSSLIKVFGTKVTSPVNSSLPKTFIPKGKYVLFLSTLKKPIAFDVLAAYMLASKTLFKQQSNIKLTAVNKGRNISQTSILTPTKVEITGNANVTRFLYRICGKAQDTDIIKSSQIDCWMERVHNPLNFSNEEQFNELIVQMNNHLQFHSYLVNYSISAIDLSLWSKLNSCLLWVQLSNNGPMNILRWFQTIGNCSLMSMAHSYLEKQEKIRLQRDSKRNSSGGKKGKKGKKKNESSASWDVGIGDEWMNKIVTRFPPEPSGFLHIGHAKAIMINYEIAKKFNGKMLVRIDDTNPSKVRNEYEQNILRDLHSLDIHVSKENFSHTSDYFDYYIKCCTRILLSGHAFVDLSTKQQIHDQRAHRLHSKYKSEHTTDDNLRLWMEMQTGTEVGCECCVRISLDMSSDNGTLRDPVIFRVNIKDEHHRTKGKYKVYPTYDFACPIVDSIEGVTHAMRSKEYNERDVQYRKIWDIVCKGEGYKGRSFVMPNIYQFSRGEFTRTVMSKRRLQILVDNGVVHGWDDPRLPTIQGIFRRGLTLEALQKFNRDQAMSKRNNKQEWDKIWSYNSKILDVKVGRYFAVSADRVRIRLSNFGMDENVCRSVPLHPKKPNGAKKVMLVSGDLWVEQWSVQHFIVELKAKEFILMNVGVCSLDKIQYGNDGSVECIHATFQPKNRNFKKKPVLTFVAENEMNSLVPITLVELDYLYINVKKKIAVDEYGHEIKDEMLDDQKRDVRMKTVEVLVENPESTWEETLAFGESAMRLLSAGDVIQIVKRGFYIVDKAYFGRVDEPAVFIFIPDGKSKEMSKIAKATNKVIVSTR